MFYGHFIKELPQVLAYNNDSKENRLFFECVDLKGRPCKPNAAPTIVIHAADGTVLVASAPMDPVVENLMTATYGIRGMLDYTAETTEFQVGEIVSGGTSKATGVVIVNRKNGSAGTLIMSNIDGNFSNAEALSGNAGGTATSSGTQYTANYCAEVDTTTVASWAVGLNYYAIVSYAETLIAAPYTYKRTLYFDVALNPMKSPVVTPEDFQFRHPTWVVPDQWSDWYPILEQAHVKLVRKIRSHGELEADFVKRAEELYGITMAFADEIAARAVERPAEEIADLKAAAQSAWSARGELTVQRDDDAEIEGDKVQIVPQLGR